MKSMLQKAISRTAASIVLLLSVLGTQFSAGVRKNSQDSFLESHLLVSYYGNPHSAAMGVLGALDGEARAAALRRQAAAYQPLTDKQVLPAYHLVAVVAQPQAGRDGMWRRREAPEVVRGLLDEARAQGFHLILDVQPGRAPLGDELAHLRPFLAEPDVHLAVDPEFGMDEGQVPGDALGHMHAAELNVAIRFLAELVAARCLPPKVLIVHQFAVGMLPDVERVEPAPGVDVVLNMDGFGSQSLKLASYRTITRRWHGTFTGFKLFYAIDTQLFTPEQIMRLTPTPSVVIYQ
jgi:hypothetical protein